jgi:hypothetical protein
MQTRRRSIAAKRSVEEEAISPATPITRAPSPPRIVVAPSLKPERKKIEVQLNVQIFRLRRIENSSEEVTLDLGITFMWEDPHLIDLARGGKNFSTHPSISRFKEMPSMQYPQLWPDDMQVGYGVFDPAWKIDNCSSIEVVKSICMLLDPAIGLVHNYIHLVATVHHTLDMAKFPFDKQDFKISIRSEHSDKVMEFVRFKDKREPKVFHQETTEWQLHPKLTLNFSDNHAAAASGMELLQLSLCSIIF